MPSSTVKERTTKVKVAGKRKGLSADACNRSSPADRTVCQEGEGIEVLNRKLEGYSVSMIACDCR